MGAQSNTTHQPVTVRPLLPSSNHLWTLAWAYLDAGDAAFSLVRSDGYSGFVVFPCVFCYFRSIELALKAVLVQHGVPEQEITRKLGHRLSALIVRAERFTTVSALGMRTEDRALLDLFSDDYSTKWFEYPDDFWRAQPNLEEVRALAHRVRETTMRNDNLQS